MKRRIQAKALLLSSLLLAGCASKPTVSDQMYEVGSRANALGNDWDSGQKLVDTGQKNRKKAQKQLADAQEKLANAERAIQDGQKLMAKTEQDFADQRVTRRP